MVSDMTGRFPSHAPALQRQFAEALGLHRAWRLAEAEQAYRGLLRIHPDHMESLHLLGDILCRQGRMTEVSAVFRALALLRPDLAEGWSDLGLALRGAGRAEQAVAALRRSVALAPDSAPAQTNLGLMLGPDGAGFFRRAILCDPGLAEAYANLGASLSAPPLLRRALLLRPEAAASWYALAGALAEPAGKVAACRAALVCRPDYGRAHNLAGLMMVEGGDLAGAARRYRRALLCERDPGFYVNLADVTHFNAEDGEIEELERLAADAASLNEEARISLHFALGKAYEDCGEFGKAFRHYLEGNGRKRRTIPYDEASVLAAMARTERDFSAAFMAREAGGGDPSEIPIFILGMPRSGSTLIEQILASHPAVHGGDERPDFPELLDAFGARAYPALGAAYVERSRVLAPQAARVTDKLPGNFRHAGAIHLALPKARIIHSRRDPVDTCLSCFTKLFRGEQAHTYDLGELGRYYRAYERLMAHWRAVLPASVFLEVDYEALVADPEAQTRRLLAHCGLDWDPACLAFHETRRPVRTASASQVRRPLYRRSVGRWRRYGPLLAPLLSELEKP
jgi:tetratricopeptide (TPR) repeat protein